MQLNFSKFSPGDKEKIEYLRSIDGTRVYTYTFTTLFSWQKDEDYSFSVYGEAYVVKNGARGDNFYLFPRGKAEDKSEIIRTLLQDGDIVFSFMDDSDREFCERYFPGMFSFSEDRDNFSYIYNRDEQIKLKGKNFKNLRREVNQAEKNFSWDIVPLTVENTKTAAEINKIWEDTHDFGKTDFDAANTALSHFDKLGMWGLLFKANGAEAAYVAGSFVKDDIFDVNFSKILIPGTDCYVKWEMYKRLPDSVKLIDSEEDMGLSGLREHKLLRVPESLSRVWRGTQIK